MDTTTPCFHSLIKLWKKDSSTPVHAKVGGVNVVATVYGALVIMPKEGTPLPFPQPYAEMNIISGEWWNLDVETMVIQATSQGLPPPTSDAHTINRNPGRLFPCPEKNTFSMEVEPGKTYLLRIINAALQDELFFAIAGHVLTVVEIGAVYTKPFTTQAILIAPGKTTNVLVNADIAPGRYFMAARPFMDAPIIVDNKTVAAILQHRGVSDTVLPSFPPLPASNDTQNALGYISKPKSSSTPQYPAKVPLEVDVLRNWFRSKPMPYLPRWITSGSIVEQHNLRDAQGWTLASPLLQHTRSLYNRLP